MRFVLAVVLASLAAGTAFADRELGAERPEKPRPCKCIKHRPQISYEVLGATAGDVVAKAAVARVGEYNRTIHQCLAAHHAQTVDLSLAFAKGTTEPRVTSTGGQALSTCVSKIAWHGFVIAPNSATIRVRASIHHVRGGRDYTIISQRD